MSTHQLNVFLVAAQTLNFTQAAQKLLMSQPSVSQHIQALERHFGEALFIRSGRSLELTDAGQVLIPLAKEAVSVSERIEETMASLQGDIYGHLLVSCATTPGKYILPAMLAAFHEQYPRVKVTCRAATQGDALQMLESSAAHFAITSVGVGTCPDFAYHHLLSDQVCLVVPRDHPWADKGAIQPEMLRGAQFIMSEEHTAAFAAIQDALGKVDISLSDLDIVLTLGNAEAIALAVQQGLGAGFISETVSKRLCGGTVAKVDIAGVSIRSEIYLAHSLRRPQTQAQIAFWEFIQSYQPA